MDGRTHLVSFVGRLDHLDRVALPRRVLELRVRAEVEAFRLQLRPAVGETCAPLDVAETAPQLQLPHLFRPLRGGRRLVTCACVCEMVWYVGAEIRGLGQIGREMRRARWAHLGVEHGREGEREEGERGRSRARRTWGSFSGTTKVRLMTW